MKDQEVQLHQPDEQIKRDMKHTFVFTEIEKIIYFLEGLQQKGNSKCRLSLQLINLIFHKSLYSFAWSFCLFKNFYWIVQSFISDFLVLRDIDLSL